MKTRLLILIVIVLAFSFNASAMINEGKALNGNSFTGFGNYSIVNAEVPMVLNNQEVQTFELSYENSGSKILIGVLQEKDCKKFVVKSSKFEVQYECNKGIFGVKKIDKKFQELPNEAMLARLNNTNLFAQRVICKNKTSENELLGLIACYFPNLINEEYQANF
jgi:hypothetical protein